MLSIAPFCVLAKRIYSGFKQAVPLLEAFKCVRNQIAHIVPALGLELFGKITKFLRVLAVVVGHVTQKNIIFVFAFCSGMVIVTVRRMAIVHRVLPLFLYILRLLFHCQSMARYPASFPN